MIERDTDLQIGTNPPCFIHDVSNSPFIKFINGDSLEILKSFSDNEFDKRVVANNYINPSLL